MPTDKQLKKARAVAAKLSKPKPIELPSGAWRCQMMIKGQRIDVIEDDPAKAHARALAIKAGILEQEKEKKEKPLTLTEAIDAYIALKDSVLSPSTIRGYETIKKHRFKSLMSKDVSKITKADVQAAVNQEAKSVSAKTVYNSYGLIRPVLKENGVDVFGVKLPQRVRPNKKYLQVDEIGKLMEAAAGDPYETEILIAVWLGLRRSEIIGLHWDCVDFEASTITVRRTVVPDKNNQWITKGGAKNETSQRTISCPDYIMDRLREQYSPGVTGRIFRAHPETISRHIHAACERAGITDTTLHGLRHTNAAIMKSVGMEDSHAMARGGWSSEETYKKTYSYVFEDHAKEDDEMLNAFFRVLQSGIGASGE